MSERISTLPDNQLVNRKQPTGPFMKSDSGMSPGPLKLWHRFTAPPPPPANASLAQRKLARRGRLGSTILLIMLTFLLVTTVTAILEHDRTSLLRVLLPSLAVSVIVLFLNRLGKITAAGIVLIAGFELGFIYALLATPGGLGVDDLPRFDLLVEPILLAVSFLPPRSVYLVALGNCIFIWADLTFMPHTVELGKLLRIANYRVLEAPIALQIIVTLVVFLWARSTNQAIKRADDAEAIVALKQTITEEKQQLEIGIQQILQTHVQAANGDLRARAPLTQDNVLWKVANSLNMLLSRLQRLNNVEQELHETKSKLQYTINTLSKQLQEKDQQIEILRKQMYKFPPH